MQQRAATASFLPEDLEPFELFCHTRAPHSPYVTFSLRSKCSFAVKIAISSSLSPNRFLCPLNSSLPFSPSPLSNTLLSTRSSRAESKGWQKYAMLYRSPPPLKVTRCTVLFSMPPVQNDSKSPMLTRIGGVDRVDGVGSTGTETQVCVEGEKSSRPGWPGRRNSSVKEP